MRRCAIKGILAGTPVATMLLFSTACTRAQTATPSPPPDGVVPAAVHGSSDVAAWLTGAIAEYAHSPLSTTLAGIVIILLIVGLLMWLRRPRKPLDTDAPVKDAVGG